MRIVTVQVCPECSVHWVVDEEPARCVEPGHHHRRVDTHQHQDLVVLPGDLPVVAVSFAVGDPYRRDQPPDHGLYLDPRWRPPWSHDHLDWPDFGVPTQPEAVVSALASMLERVRAGERVEIGCLGAHGRTGTALGVLAVLTGVPADAAVDWVRTAYCPQAVETSEQRAFVAGLHEV